MKGKLFRQIKDGCIYEVVGTAEEVDSTLHYWRLWSERTGEWQSVADAKLKRQLGWELVGRADKTSVEEARQEAPPALLK